ncbi:MAG: hypothetical protein R3E86_08850 [Pseudomonadales bacterium]
MIYFIGGAARTGKSTLCQRFAASKGFGWISTDLISELLREAGTKMPDAWDARPESISERCEKFFPFLERFVVGANSMTNDYVIEGVDFLPRHLTALEDRVSVNGVFLGRSEMTLETIRKFHGKSPGYSALSEDTCRQIVADVPLWSSWIESEAKELGYSYIDMSGHDFIGQLGQALSILHALEGRHRR